MELIATGALLTLASDPGLAGRDAWIDPALIAAEACSEPGTALWPPLVDALESAGWSVQGSTAQTVALPLLPILLRADAALGSLLDRRGAHALPEAAGRLLDGWWQAGLALAGDGQLGVTVASLSNDLQHRATATVHSVQLPPPSWRWLVRSQLVSVQVQRMTMRLEPDRHQAAAGRLQERARPLRQRLSCVRLDD